MKKILIIFLFSSSQLFTQYEWNNRHSYIQTNNINTVVIADGIFNFDRFFNSNPGLIWPVTSTTRKTADYTTCLWIGAKVGPQRELRVAAGYASSHYSPGNIPVTGQVPPVSVCNDTSWKVYLVNLNDQTLVNGGQRIKTAGGRTYTFYYTSWADWPVGKGAPYAEINNIPGYQPGWNSDRPGIGNGSRARPEEICFSVYMDYKNCTNLPHQNTITGDGTLPLGIEIHQLTFMFSCPTLNNMYFVKWRLINKSQYNWDSVYISLFNDADIGERHDKAGCDTLRNMSFTYNNNDSDYVYGRNPPAIGFPFLQSPLKYTGNNNDTAKLPYDTLIGYRILGMTGHFATCNACPGGFGDPGTADVVYYFMRGFNGMGQPIINYVTGLQTKFMYPGDACRQIGWYDSSVVADRRNIQNSGPFVMNIGDTQIVVSAFIVTNEGGNNFQNVCALQNLADTALKYYYNDFQTCIPIGIIPVSSEIPETFSLSQNYPNPFNPVTKIRFEIPSVGAQYPPNGGQVIEPVRIKIYDILGREVATLVDEKLLPGIYEVEWNGSDYSSGIYYYTFSSGNYLETKKMVLIK